MITTLILIWLAGACLTSLLIGFFDGDEPGFTVYFVALIWPLVLSEILGGLLRVLIIWLWGLVY